MLRGPWFIRVQDKARLCVARVCRQLLDEAFIGLHVPQAKSHVRTSDLMSQCLKHCHMAPQTIQEFSDGLT